MSRAFRPWAVLALAACTPAQVPRAKTIAEVLAIGGLGGMGAAGLVETVSSADAKPILVGSAVISATGVIGWALLELQFATPDDPTGETIAQRNHRWAKELTSRAEGAARENNCARVKRLEVRVHVYDPEIHDFVFMRDQEILRCLQE